MITGTRRSLLLSGGACLLAGAARAAEPRLADPGYYQVWEEVGHRVAVVRQPEPFQVQPSGNVTVIEQADGLVLVDSGGSPGAGRRLVALIRERRPGKPVKAVILTHWHGDHPLGLSEILKAWPAARTIATEATRAHLSDPKTMNTPATPDAAANAAMVARFKGFADYARDKARTTAVGSQIKGWTQSARLFEQYAVDMDGALTLSPREGFTDRLLIDDREAPVEALFLGRANTDGDALVWLPRQRTMVTGDVLVAPIPFGFGSYPSDWIAVLKKIRTYQAETLIPGHGAPMTDDRYLVRVGALLESVRSQVKRAVAQGLDVKAARAAVDLNGMAAYFTGGDTWKKTWFDSYFTDPIVVSAWKEAKGLPIVQSLSGE